MCVCVCVCVRVCVSFVSPLLCFAVVFLRSKLHATRKGLGLSALTSQPFLLHGIDGEFRARLTAWYILVVGAYTVSALHIY